MTATSYLQVILAITALLCLFYLYFRLHYLRQSKVRRAAGEGFDSFIASIQEGGSPFILEAVYGLFSKWPPVYTPVRPSDSLDKTFGIVGGEVVDVLQELASKCGLPPPSEQQCAQVRTVGDVVSLLEVLRRSTLS